MTIDLNNFTYRESDQYIIEEIFRNLCYDKLSVTPDDVVLDLGLNIGCFSLWCYQRGVKTIVGYEPCKDNYLLAKKNVGSFAEVIDMAVVGDDRQAMDLYISSDNSGKNSSVATYRKEGVVSVKCVNINDVLSKYPFTCMKMDVEGGEIEIIGAIRDFGKIDKMVIEYHNNIFRHTYQTSLFGLSNLISRLESDCFDVSFQYDEYAFLIFAKRSKHEQER